MAGRPPLFKTVSELETKVSQYFDGIEDDGKSPTITGLALFLGFESRQSFYDYEKNGEFSYTIKKNRLRIECSYEEALLSRNSTGAIFALKNFGWKDKTEVDTNLTLKGSISPNKWLEENSNGRTD